MKRNFGHSSSRRRRGVTLVEAAAGTAILGTLLVGIVLAGVRLGAQTRASEQRIEACRAADQLLQTWWADPARLPREGGGEVAGHPGWTWRTQKTAGCFAAEMGIDTVSLEIHAPGAADRPAARVEFLVPPKPAADSTAPPAGNGAPPVVGAQPQTNNAPSAPSGMGNETTLGPDTH